MPGFMLTADCHVQSGSPSMYQPEAHNSAPAAKLVVITGHPQRWNSISGKPKPSPFVGSTRTLLAFAISARSRCEIPVRYSYWSARMMLLGLIARVRIISSSRTPPTLLIGRLPCSLVCRYSFADGCTGEKIDHADRSSNKPLREGTLSFTPTNDTRKVSA